MEAHAEFCFPQICKALLADCRGGPPFQSPAFVASPSPREAAALVTTGGVPLELVARCARKALAAVRAACDDGAGGWDAGRAGLVTWLVETEALPQAGLHNLYGPTEAAVDVSWHVCTPASTTVSGFSAAMKVATAA